MGVGGRVNPADDDDDEVVSRTGAGLRGARSDAGLPSRAGGLRGSVVVLVFAGAAVLRGTLIFSETSAEGAERLSEAARGGTVVRS
jgi:hypothetical protein